MNLKSKSSCQSVLLVIALLLLAISLLAACEATPATPEDTLDQMFAAQDKATEGAKGLQQAAAHATTKADATRDALDKTREATLLQGQQTRMAENAGQTQTTFAQRVQETATAQSANSTSTVQANWRTGTAVAVIIEATRTSASQTSAADAANAQQTRASASETRTSVAFNAQQTRAAATATASRVADVALSQHTEAEAERSWTNVWTFVKTILIWVLVIGVCVLVGFLIVRLVDAVILRMRIMRDRTGVPYVITEADRSGRRQILAPTRAPSAVTMLTPPGVEPLQIEASAVDPDTTKRDQAVSLMIAATSGARGGSDAGETIEGLLGDGRMQVVDQPPTHLVSGDVPQLLEAQWKEVKDDGNK